jgi:tight adherence protein B
MLGAGLFLVWWSAWVPAPRASSAGPVRPTWSTRLHDDLRQADMTGVRPRGLLLTCAGASLVVLLAVLAVSSSPPIAVCFALIASRAPVALVRVRARRRRTTVRDLWPEAVDHLTSGIRAGLSLPEALAQLGDRGPAELRPAFRTFAEDYRATGRFVECLDRLKERLADPVADRIVEALRLTREVGGSDLGRLLRTLSAFLRDDARTRAELEARQSWTVNAARLAVAAPWIVLALLSTRPEAVTAYNTTTGALVLGLGGVVSVVAYRVMVRVGRLPEESRVLR